MTTKFAKVVQTAQAGLNLFGDYLEGILTALYEIGVEKGKTEFGFLGDQSVYDMAYDSGDEKLIEMVEETLDKWKCVFANINYEYVNRSCVVSGITYSLEKVWNNQVFVKVKRFQDTWDGVFLEEGDPNGRDVEVDPYTVDNHPPLIKLIKLIAEDLDVDLDQIKSSVAAPFEKVVKTYEGGLELYGDYLADKLSALYKVGVEKGKTVLGYMNDESAPESSENAADDEEEPGGSIFEWYCIFAEINDEYVEGSHVVAGVTYELNERSITILRYLEDFDGDVIDGDRSTYVYVDPHVAAHHRSLAELMPLLAKNLGVNLDEI